MSVMQFLINSSHYVEGSGNTFVYRLPQGRSLNLNANTHSVAVSSCSVYNSTFNIKASWGNNKIVILSSTLNLANLTAYPNGSTYTDPISGKVINQKYFQITIPDGYWDVASIQSYLEQQMELAGFFFKSTDGSSNIFFLQCNIYQQQYRCGIDLFTIPNAIPTDFMMPTNACFSLPTTTQSPYVYFPEVQSTSPCGSLARIFGFKEGTLLPHNISLPLTGLVTTSTQNVGTECPVVSPISTYLLTSNLIHNPKAIPDDLLLQLNVNSKFGAPIVFSDFPQFVTAKTQSASELKIALYDERFVPLELQDRQFSLVLSIKEEKEKK